MKAHDIKPARNAARVKQDELAKALGWNIATLTDIERGRVGIDIETYTEIMSAVNRIGIRAAGGAQLEEVNA